MGIGTALRWEAQAVLAALRSCGGCVSAIGHGIWHADVGGVSLFLYRTGVGPKAARTATRRALRRHPASLVINTGCAGGLQHDLVAGDLIIADQLLSPPPEATCIAVDSSSRQMLHQIAAATAPRVRGGTLLTSRTPLLTRTVKQEHGSRWAADAVDMEGSAVAQAAAESGSRFLSIRAIIDPASSDLPLLAQWAATGHGATRRPRLSALLTPQQLRQYTQLVLDRRRAGRALQNVYTALFTALREGTIDEDLFGLR